MSSPIIANVLVTINSFAPYTGNGGSIDATLALGPGTPASITLNNNTLIVDVPAGTPVQFNYSITNPNSPDGGLYFLLGLYFTSTTGDPKEMGADQFPLAILSREESFPVTVSEGGVSTTIPANSMVVIDENYGAGEYTYLILVQDTAQPAAIGAIDPEVENED